MICPKCNTFQPTAETCHKCGVFVAKLWAQQSSPGEAEIDDLEDAPKRRSTVLGALAVTVFAALGFGAWLSAGPGDETLSEAPGTSGLSGTLVAWQSAMDAQEAAIAAQERIEAAAYAMDGNTSVYRTANRMGRSSPPSGVSDAELDALARNLNTVARIKAVALEGKDLYEVYGSCQRYIGRYFKPLTLRQANTYPLPVPEQQAYQDNDLDGRYRCEGSRGTVYLNTRPASRDGIRRCWAKQSARQFRAPGGKREKSPPFWVRMQWDDEAQRWSIYTVADQRQVDRARIRQARVALADDIGRSYRSREASARRRVPDLVGKVEDTREKLTVLAGEANRDRYTALLRSHERDLKHALIGQRYTQICRSAATAALDKLETRL